VFFFFTLQSCTVAPRSIANVLAAWRQSDTHSKTTQCRLISNALHWIRIDFEKNRISTQLPIEPDNQYCFFLRSRVIMLSQKWQHFLYSPFSKN